MYPILFKINGVAIYSHGFFFLTALLAGTALLVFEARRRHWPKEEVIPITLAAFVGGMIGARLSILFFNGWETAPIVLNFYALFDPRIGPGSIIGGVAGAYFGGYIASKAIGKAGCACDAFAPAMALATAIGRIGDFMAAEDGLGKPTGLPWGVPVPGANAGSTTTISSDTYAGRCPMRSRISAMIAGTPRSATSSLVSIRAPRFRAPT